MILYAFQYLSTSICCNIFLKSDDIMNRLNRDQVNTFEWIENHIYD